MGKLHTKKIQHKYFEDILKNGKNLRIVIEANKELYKLLKIELKPKYEFEKVLIK